MKILLITHYFAPEIGAPSARLYEMAKYWVQEGHDVTVLTGFPNHPTGIIPPEYKGHLSMKENMDGINVIRSYVYATPNEGFIKKTMGHISFMFSSVLQSFFKVSRPDVVVVSSPTYFSMFSAVFYSVFKRSKLVLDIRDLWPAAIVELGVLKNKIIIGVLEGFEKMFYRKASSIVVVTKSFKTNLVDRGIPAGKIEVITNGVEEEKYMYNEQARVDLRKELGYSEQDFIVLYIGAHGISQALNRVIEVANSLRDKSEIKFLFVGEGAEKKKLIELTKSYELKNVTFIGGQPKEKITSFYSLSDVCVVPLKNVPLFETFIPSKMFEIMSNSRPLIASLSGESADIIREAQAGMITKPENEEEMAAAILNLYSDEGMRKTYGENGRRFVSKNYTRKSLAKKYLSILGK
jgi:glycosyltransferase involved in cell wall biosynthesis